MSEDACRDPFIGEGPSEGWAWSALVTIHVAGPVQLDECRAAHERRAAASEAAADIDDDLAEVWDAHRTLDRFTTWADRQVAEYGEPQGGAAATAYRRWIEAVADPRLFVCGTCYTDRLAQYREALARGTIQPGESWTWTKPTHHRTPDIRAGSEPS